MRNFTLLLLLCLPAAIAHADAISPPPTTCVDGSMGVLCHGPPRCAPATCTTDVDCSAGHVCRPQPLCIETISCGGITTTMDPNVLGTCLTGHCAAGGTCMTQLVCVTSSSPIDDVATPDGTAIDSPAIDAGRVVAAGACCSTPNGGGRTGGLIATFGLALVTAARKVKGMVRRDRRGAR